jgi:hypothetical protein
VLQRSQEELHPAHVNLVKIIISLSVKIYLSFVRSRCEFMKFLATLVFPCVTLLHACYATRQALLVLSKINYARYSTEIFYQFMLTFRHICKYITKKYSKSSAEQHQKLFTSRRVLLQQVEISSDSVWLDSESDGAEISTGAAQLLAERVS